MRRWITTGAVVFAGFNSMYGQSHCIGDINNDQIVNVQDVLLLFAHFGDSCPTHEDSNANLQLSEIHYNPNSQQGDDSDYEFIELYNLGDEEVLLENWYFSSGISCTFDEFDRIPALGYFVIAANLDSLIPQMPESNHYCQWDSGQELNNNGETIILHRPNGSIADEVAFEDNDGWVTPPDGMGPSLEWMDPNLPNEEESSWSASFPLGGTPGAANSMWGFADSE